MKRHNAKNEAKIDLVETGEAQPPSETRFINNWLINNKELESSFR